MCRYYFQFRNSDPHSEVNREMLMAVVQNFEISNTGTEMLNVESMNANLVMVITCRIFEGESRAIECVMNNKASAPSNANQVLPTWPYHASITFGRICYLTFF